jgi:hypothetical protein
VPVNRYASRQAASMVVLMRTISLPALSVL